MGSRDLEKLHPELRRRWHLIDRFWRHANPDGPRLFVICTYRSPEEQDDLFAQGKTKARAHESLHNYEPAYALDFGFQLDGVYLCGDADIPMYHVVGRAAERCGLEWGGRWYMRDYGHIQAANLTWQQAGFGIEPNWTEITEDMLCYREQ